MAVTASNAGGLEKIVIAALTDTRRFPNHGFHLQRSITARDCPTRMLAGSFLADASTGQPSRVYECPARLAFRSWRARIVCRR